MPTNTPNDRICFIDIETCGLNDFDPVLEIAMIPTDMQLRVVGLPIQFVIWATNEAMHTCMDEFVLDMHTKNGLIADVQASAFHTERVELALMEWMQHTFDSVKPHMAGSGIQFDRRVLRAQMPDLHNLFHYRNFPDVSGFKRAVEWWMPEGIADTAPKSDTLHRAMPDCEDALEYARWFRSVPMMSTTPRLHD